MATQNHYIVFKTSAPWVIKLTQVGGTAPTPASDETLYTAVFTFTTKGPGTAGFVPSTAPTWEEYASGTTPRIS